MTELATYFNNAISRDLFQLCTGAKLADGSTRTVFKLALNPSQVLKYETVAGRFQNIMEWETWQMVRWTKFAKWFAPCHHISDCGTILIQEYCRDLTNDEIPEELPAFFTDIKRENFGMHGGNVVCRDYGLSLLMDRGLTNKMKKAEW